jgi:Spy/CpxP family protein refolding chaperone
MDISVKDLQEAISIRQQIDNLQRRLSSLLRGAPQTPAPEPRTTPSASGRYFSPSTRAKLSAAARARWARRQGTGTAAAPAKGRGQLTPAGRRKLSQLMKARWAARRKAGGKQKPSTRKKGVLTPAGRKRLSELMKARWAARRKAASK